MATCNKIDDYGGVSVGGISNRTLVYRYVSDAKSTPRDVRLLSHSGSPDAVPRLYQYDVDSNFVTGIQVRREHPDKLNSHRWLITVTAGELPSRSESPRLAIGGTDIEIPTDRAPVRWIEHLPETRIVVKDVNGNQIVNSAGQPFDEPLNEEYNREVYVVRRYYTDVEHISKINAEYENSVNSVAHGTQYAVGTMRHMLTSGGEPIWDQNVQYWPAESRFAISPTGWDVELLSQGWQYKEIDTQLDEHLVDARDRNGQLVSEPVLLGAIGEQLAPDDPPYYLTYTTKTPKDYTAVLTDGVFNIANVS